MFIIIRTPTWQSHTERIWNSWCHWQSTILKKIVICKLQCDLDIWIIHSNVQFGKFWKRKLIPKFYWWLHLYLWCVARFGKPATSLKVTFLHGCFSRFLNCTNGTKSRKASHLLFEGYKRLTESILVELTTQWTSGFGAPTATQGA